MRAASASSLARAPRERVEAAHEIGPALRENAARLAVSRVSSTVPSASTTRMPASV